MSATRLTYLMLTSLYLQEALFRETDFASTVDLNATLFLTSQNVRSHLAAGKEYTVDSRKYDKITLT